MLDKRFEAITPGWPDVKVWLLPQQISTVGVNADAEFNLSDSYNKLQSLLWYGSNIASDPDIGAVFRRPAFIYRNNYIENASGDLSFDIAYEANNIINSVVGKSDGDVEFELNQRVWRAFPWFTETEFGFDPLDTRTEFNDQDFVYPTNNYPSNYNGVRWSNIKRSEMNITDLGSVSTKAFIQGKETDLAANIKPESISWPWMNTSNYNSRFIIRQKSPLAQGQSFWIELNKNEVSNLTLDENDPYGPFFALVIGWGTIYSYTIYFPIGGVPYIIDNNMALADARNDRESGITSANIDDFNKALEYVLRYQVVASQAPDEGWILKNDNRNPLFIFYFVQNRLVIKSNYTNNSWVFPNNEKTINIGLENGESLIDYFYMPSSNLIMFGKGYSFAFNFNPMEFFPGDSFIQVGLIQIPKKELLKGESVEIVDILGGKNFTIIPNTDNINLRNEYSSGYTYGVDVLGNEKTTMNLDAFNCVRTYEINEIENMNPTGAPVNSPLYDFKGIEANFDSQYGQYARGGLGSRFFTPFLFRIKCQIFIPKLQWNKMVDITEFAIEIRQQLSSDGYTGIKQQYDINCFIPKWSDSKWGSDIINNVTSSKFSFGDFGEDNYVKFNPREYWFQLARKSCTVVIEAGWKNAGLGYDGQARKIIFSGITSGGDINLSNERDTITFKCHDITSILEDAFIMNSPFFDGMAIDNAVRILLGRAGFSNKVGVNGSLQIDDEGILDTALPMGGGINSPAVKFRPGKTILSCIKEVTQKYLIVFRWDPTRDTDYGGAFVLGFIGGIKEFRHSDVQGGLQKAQAETNLIFDENAENEYRLVNAPRWISSPGGYNLSQRNFHTFVDGTGSFSLGDSKPKSWEIALEKKIINVNARGHANALIMTTLDRFGGKIMTGGDVDVASLTDPSAENFLGYYKARQYRKSALGSREFLQEALAYYKRFEYNSKTLINFTTIGRNDILPLQICIVDGNAYRITSISGNISIDGNNMKWTQTISGENLSSKDAPYVIYDDIEKNTG